MSGSMNNGGMTVNQAMAILNKGLQRIDLVQPEAIREPVRNYLRSCVERCQLRSIFAPVLGLPIAYGLEIAQALREEPGD